MALGMRLGDVTAVDAVKKAWTFSLVFDGLFRIFVVAMEVKGR